MKRTSITMCAMAAVVVALLAAAALPAAESAKGKTARSGEKLDRGVVARSVGEGKVYVGWRLLESDAKGVAFNVYRSAASGGEATRLNDRPIRRTTDFLDTNAPNKGDAQYFVRPLTGKKEGPPSAKAVCRLGEKDAPITIKLEGDYTFQKVGIADLDGDGAYDFVIKQPSDNIDPYEKYWKPSPDTYKLEAYRSNGEFLWRYDLGWAIERGIWYSPYLVYDLDGDGKAEVVAKTGEGDPRDKDGRVQTGPEYLTILDGATGKEITRADWIPRGDFVDRSGYNHASRNQLAVAWLDGRRPSLLVERGTYDLMILLAYRYENGKLQQEWRWDNADLGKEWQAQGAHWMHSADIDADGRDEVILGSSVVDENGKSLWTTGLGHPDHCYLGDIDPTHPGLEIYYGIERRQEKNGMCLVDARTGQILWGIDRPTKHVHNSGMAADIDAEHPGSECYSADSDPAKGKSLAWAMLHSAQGELLSEEVLGGFSPDVVWWDADRQRELVLDDKISDYGGKELGVEIEGSLVAVADILGDWREELITSSKGELRIYTTAIPATDRRPCLMQDPIYRADVIHAAMGYYQIPMTSYDMASQPQEGRRQPRKP